MGVGGMKEEARKWGCLSKDDGQEAEGRVKE